MGRGERRMTGKKERDGGRAGRVARIITDDRREKDAERREGRRGETRKREERRKWKRKEKEEAKGMRK